MHKVHRIRTEYRKPTPGTRYEIRRPRGPATPYTALGEQVEMGAVRLWWNQDGQEHQARVEGGMIFLLHGKTWRAVSQQSVAAGAVKAVEEPARSRLDVFSDRF